MRRRWCHHRDGMRRTSPVILVTQIAGAAVVARGTCCAGATPTMRIRRSPTRPLAIGPLILLSVAVAPAVSVAPRASGLSALLLLLMVSSGRSEQ